MNDLILILTQFIHKISSNKYKNILGNKLYTTNNKYNTDYVKMIDSYLLHEEYEKGNTISEDIKKISITYFHSGP